MDSSSLNIGALPIWEIVLACNLYGFNHASSVQTDRQTDSLHMALGERPTEKSSHVISVCSCDCSFESRDNNGSEQPPNKGHDEIARHCGHPLFDQTTLQQTHELQVSEGNSGTRVLDLPLHVLC